MIAFVCIAHRVCPHDESYGSICVCAEYFESISTYLPFISRGYGLTPTGCCGLFWLYDELLLFKVAWRSMGIRYRMKECRRLVVSDLCLVVVDGSMSGPTSLVSNETVVL